MEIKKTRSMSSKEIEVGEKSALKVKEISSDVLPVVTENLTSAYMNSISSSTPLSREREKELGFKIKEGDLDALHELVYANLKFVVSVALRYNSSLIPLSDLINQGNLGLLEAARRFDPERGVKFISYGIWWIRQSIVQLLSERSGAVRLPIKQVSVLFEINYAEKKFLRENSREATVEDVANLTGLSVNLINNIKRVTKNYLSLDSRDMNNDSKALVDDIKSPDNVEDSVIEIHMNDTIKDLVSGLEQREQEIISLRFGLKDGVEHTLDYISKIFKISKERVRQIESKALEKLKKKALELKMRDYLN